MLAGIFMPLLSFFIVNPFMATLNERLAAVQAPQAMMEQVQACASTAPTALAERAAGDLWWGASTVIGVAVGMTDARMIIAGASPACARVVAALAAVRAS